MVEVFKTNVKDRLVACILIEAIHRQFNHYKANFDLHDRDRILRVESSEGPVQNELVLNLLMCQGIDAEVLPDELPLFDSLMIPIQYATDEYK